jgi:alcohol dehydrogenase class IV
VDDVVVEGAAFGRAKGCEQVIAIGGGAAIDAGKAIAAAMTNEGALLDYLEVIGHAKALTVPPAPFTAIPTTAGTGAEVTRNAVIASAAHHVKVSLRSPWLMARVVIVDPELTYGLPPYLTAITGMDALTQLLEAFVCTRATPLTDGFCREGLQRAGRSLRRVFAAGGDRAGREDMALASLLSGMALANAGLGAVHGIAAPLGGMFTAPHGAVCAALLPRVVEANLRALLERAPDSPSLARYRETATLLGAPPDDLAGWLQNLVDDFDLPRLGVFGVGEQHLAELAQRAARANSMKANPIELSQEELRQLIRAAL